jgi:hypothetical protein
MTTLANTTQNSVLRALHKSGLLAEHLDYHIVRASIVIMFLFFGYPPGIATEDPCAERSELAELIGNGRDAPR